MKRTTLSLAVAVAVLVLIAGIATLTKPSSGNAAAPAAAKQVPVQRADAVCPQIRATPGAATLYSAVAPGGGADAAGGEAVLAKVADKAEQPGRLDAVGKPKSVLLDQPEIEALGWTASGAYAPGFAAQSTTRLGAGPGRGLSGAVCQAPGTDHWFVGTSNAENREAYLYLSNSTNVSAQIDVELYGPDGQVQAEGGRSLVFPPGKSDNIRLKTLAPNGEVAAVHVLVRSGRIAAAVRDQNGAAGTDWVPQAGRPGRSFVVPGLPQDATNVTLVMYGASDTDTDVGIQLAGKASTFTPAGFESATVKRGRTTVVDLGDITKGEAAALKLTASRADILVGVRVTRGSGETTDVAFLAPTPALTGRAVLADNRAGGTLGSLVYLTAPEGPAKVKLTSTPAAGDTATAEVDVPAGTTVAVPVPVPAGAAQFALTVEPQAGSGPVHAARMLSEQADKLPMFTIQGMSPARDSVALPTVRGDMAIMVPEEPAAKAKK
ncbi:DUF5719 family protein [Yinghuangia soli]|uniref:DUF5719 family protein n=1 Tax=Yinghuangia soli TaxID=2908204 RepID=A0AA41Q6Y4_9ACTN|nr:DUF5719 family protein [Yinghuangia soli]MCF2532698.1 DUF5719 family protein [Yinghuangia soli]